MDLTFTPSPALDGKFKIVNTTVPIYHSKIGKFDLRTISAEDALRLVKSGSNYIKAINQTFKTKKAVK